MAAAAESVTAGETSGVPLSPCSAGAAPPDPAAGASQAQFALGGRQMLSSVLLRNPNVLLLMCPML